MARQKRNKKSKIVKNFLIVGGVLAAVQLGLILYFNSSIKPTDIKDAIELSLSKQAGLAPKAKEQLKLQLAVNHFQAENGSLPASLNDLIPVYFDSLPLDPDTQKPYAYQVEAGRFFIGERFRASDTLLARNQTGTQAANLSQEEKAQKEQEALIASLDENVNLVSFVYDPRGKRDPFRPYDTTPVLNTTVGQGLQGYDIGQLRLTAVVDKSLLTIEDQSGKGFIARKGDKIGLNNGEIVEIESDRIKILETRIEEFTGKEINRVIEMELRNSKPKA